MLNIFRIKKGQKKNKEKESKRVSQLMQTPKKESKRRSFVLRILKNRKSMYSNRSISSSDSNIFENAKNSYDLLIPKELNMHLLSKNKKFYKYFLKHNLVRDKYSSEMFKAYDFYKDFKKLPDSVEKLQSLGQL